MKHTKYFAFLLLLVGIFAFSATSFAQEVTPVPEVTPEPAPVTCSVFFDDFEDGDFTIAPEWVDANGTGIVVDLGGNLALSATSDTIFSSAVAVTTTADVLEFGFDGLIYGNNLDDTVVMTINGTDGHYYSLLMSTSEISLMADGVAIVVTGGASVDVLHGLRATRSAGTWELFVDGASVGTGAEPFGTTAFDSVVLAMNGSPVADNVDIVADCVAGVNQAPVAEDFEVITVEDTAVSFGFLDHASDPDGDPLTVIIDTDVQAGSLIVDETGGATFTPDPEWGGAVSATYHVNDGVLDSNVATVYIWVLPVNDAPNCDAAGANISEIWPPNHKTVPVSIDENSISDVDSTEFSTSLDDISSNEPVNGLGDGNTAPDWSVEEGWVRAERSGTGNGRIYSVAFSADDLNWTGIYENLTDNPAYDYDDSILIDGGDCSGAVGILVPHDQGNKGNPPADNPPADNPPADNPPADNPPADNPPADNPPADNPPVNNPPAVSGSENAHGNNPNANPHAAAAGDNGKNKSNGNDKNVDTSSSAALPANANGKANGKNK